MPITLSVPKTFTLDKVQIQQFTVVPGGRVEIHFAKGYEDESGNFIAKEFSRADLNNVTIEPELYDAVKTKLYQLLQAHLDDSSGSNDKP